MQVDICERCDGSGMRCTLSGAKCFECNGTGFIEERDDEFDEYEDDYPWDDSGHV
jgi:DnaJ-class molecular chaperone